MLYLRSIVILSVLCAVIFPVGLAAQTEDPFGTEVSLQRPDPSLPVLRVVFRVPADHYLYADEIAISVDGAVLKAISVPQPVEIDDPFMGERVQVYKTDVVLLYAIEGEVAETLDVNVAYMGCNDSVCFMPSGRRFSVSTAGAVDEGAPGAETPPLTGAGLFEGFSMTGRGAGYMSPAELISFIEGVETGRGLERSAIERLFSGRGVLIGLLAILLGGLALNLTPCVLPMIPVNIAIIGAGAQARSRMRGFLLGATYGAGIALVYGVLGVVVVLTGAQFGTLNASPGFNFGIAVLFAVLALAMFGVFNLDFSHYQSGLAAGKTVRSAYPTSLFFGGVAALLAGACVAPVVISVLVLATEVYQRGGVAGLLLPFALGMGMALPWPFAGAGLSFLPKPGRWMDQVKIGFGVVIMAAAAYYGFMGFRLLRPAPAPAVESTSGDRGVWLRSPAAAVAQSRSTGMPLFIDFWATWCKNCMAMDATTFRNDAVMRALEPYVRLKYQAENPRDPETKRVLERFGVKGLPSYVVLQPER